MLYSSVQYACLCEVVNEVVELDGGSNKRAEDATSHPVMTDDTGNSNQLEKGPCTECGGVVVNLSRVVWIALQGVV